MAFVRKCISLVQRHMPAFAGVGLSGVVAVSMLPQTVLLSRYRKILAHVQKNGEERPVDSHTQSIVQKVFQRIVLKPEEEADLPFFTCFATDPVHKGSLQTKFRAVIGLPATFAYREISDVNKEELDIDQQSTVGWDSEHGEALLKALVLSDKAKAFVIAREINYTRSFHLHIETILKSLSGVLAYTTGYTLNQWFHLNRRLRFWARFSLYSLITAVWILIYVATMDTYRCWLDNSADRKAARLNKLYAEGGVEYYTKLLARNQALRAMMGTRGPSKFTVYGNDVSVWRRSHVELTTRRDNLCRYLQEIEASKAVN